MPHPLGNISWSWAHFALLALGILCAATDTKSGKIYNLVTYPAMVLGLVLHAGGNWVPEIFAVLGLLVGLVPFAFASLRGLIGGGDAKLFGAVGALGGFPYILHFLLWTFGFSLIYALLTLVWDRVFLSDLFRWVRAHLTRNPRTAPVLSGSTALKRRVPLGLFALLGILATLHLV
ncbi:MAG: A24 family peptidase [Bacteroidota bacterium]